MTVTQAQSQFTKLCRESRSILVIRHDKPVSVLLPIVDYEALMETIDLLSDPKAMKVLRAAKEGKLAYKLLDHDDENLRVK